MHVSKTVRKITFSYVSYVKILRKSLRKKIRTCECSFNKRKKNNMGKEEDILAIFMRLMHLPTFK